jgi:uncharacterized protein
MKIASQDNVDTIKITQVTPISVNVGDSLITQPFFVGTNHSVNLWVQNTDKVSVDAIKKLPLEQYELLLIGTGDHYTWLENECMSFLVDTIPFETMTTVSACRTFNIVAGEGRKVLLAALVGCDSKAEK